MAIAYSETHCLVTDDVGDRPPLTFLRGQTQEIEEAGRLYSMPTSPAPDWAQMRQALQTENGFPGAWDAVFQANPQIAGMIGPRLDFCEINGIYHLFIDALLRALATLNNQAQAAEVAVEFAALAERCHMPAEFLAELDRRLLSSQG